MGKRILVTGGAGFIGNWLSLELANLGNEVVAVDNDIRGGVSTANFSNENITFLQLDLNDLNSVIQIFSNYQFDLIYHLAALNGTQNFYEKPFDVIKNSSLPIINMIDVMKSLNLRVPIIYTGSSETYSRGITIGCNTVPTAEDAEIVLGPLSESRWSYGSAKAFSEYVLQSAYDQLGIKFIIARVHNIYGPRMGFNHFISDVISRFRQGDFKLYGSGETRSFCHISDAVFALISLSESEKSWGHIINIGSDDERSILSVASIIAKELKINNNLIESMGSWEGSVHRRCPDIAKLKTMLEGEFPRIGIEDGIKEMVEWYNDKRIISEGGFK